MNAHYNFNSYSAVKKNSHPLLSCFGFDVIYAQFVDKCCYKLMK